MKMNTTSAPRSIAPTTIRALTTLGFCLASLATATAWAGVGGLGTAVVDGVKSPGEWDGAAQLDVFDGALAGSTAFVMNDGASIYLALEVVGDADLSSDDIFVVRFDNDDNEVHDIGDDRASVSVAGYSDGLWGPDWSRLDVAAHGEGAAGRTGDVNFFEIAKPLRSGDGQDIDLAVGDQAGFCLRYFVNGTANNSSTYPVDCVYIRFEQTKYDTLDILASDVTLSGERYGLDQINWNGTSHQAGGVTRVGGYVREPLTAYDAETLVRFDTDGLSGSVASATLRVRVDGGTVPGPATIELFEQDIVAAWDPATVNYAAFTSGPFSSDSWGFGLGDVLVDPATPGWVEITSPQLTGLVDEWIADPAANTGVVLTGAFWHWDYRVEIGDVELVVEFDG